MKRFLKKNLKTNILIVFFILGVIVLLFPFSRLRKIEELPETGEGPELAVEIQVDKSDIQRDDPSEDAQELTYTVTVRNDAECTSNPVDTVLVYDKSGSMCSLMNDARQAGVAFVNNLDFTKDLAGLVTYDDNSYLVQELTSSKNDVINAINSIRSGGLTNIGAGIALAREELLSSRHNSDATPVMIIFTDGVANRPAGVDPEEYALSQADLAKQSGIRIISIAYGSYADQDLMREIASTGPDNYFWAESGVDMVRIYAAISESLQGDSPDTVASIDLSQVLGFVDVVSSDPIASITGGQIKWDLGTLECQESAILTFSLEVNNNVQDLDIIDLLVDVTNSSGYSVQNEHSAITIIHAPRFNLSKTDNKEEAMPGDGLDYEISVENLGTGNAYDVVFTDSVPGQYLEINESSISDNGTYLHGVIEWNNDGEGFDLDGSFSPLGSENGNSLKLEFSGLVYEDLDPGIYELVNTVRLQTAGGITLEAIDNTDVPYAPDLVIEKTSNPEYLTYPGGTVEYILTIKNEGNLDAENVVVEDDYDESLMSITNSEGQIQSGKIIWYIDELKVGESMDLTYTATVSSNIGENSVTIPNEAVVSSRYDDINLANNVALHEVLATLDPVLEISHETDKVSYVIGEEVEYSITVTNNSYADAYNLTLSDTIPLEFEYIIGTTTLDGESYSDPSGSNILSWVFDGLRVGESFVLKFKARVGEDTDEGNFTATAQLNWEDESENEFGPEVEDAVVSVIVETAIGEVVIEEEPQDIIDEIVETARSILGRLVRTGDALVYLKVILGLALALPLPLMLIFGAKRARKRKVSKNKKRVKKTQKKSKR